ncbi:MAG: hypothetical protein ABIH76_07115 [Candidatus Bathyarchaeota archaeon]
MENRNWGSQQENPELIFEYTSDPAIKDGTHADFGRINDIRIIATTTLLATVNTYQLLHIVTKTLDRIR